MYFSLVLTPGIFTANNANELKLSVNFHGKKSLALGYILYTTAENGLVGIM